MAVDHILGNRDTIFHTKGAPGSIDGRRYYTLYNEQTGHTEIKEATWGGDPTDRTLGHRLSNFHTKGAPGSMDGRRYYTLYNQDTGHTEIKEATWGGAWTDRYIGKYIDGKFHRDNGKGSDEEVAFFQSPEGTSTSCI